MLRLLDLMPVQAALLVNMLLVVVQVAQVALQVPIPLLPLLYAPTAHPESIKTGLDKTRVKHVLLAPFPLVELLVVPFVLSDATQVVVLPVLPVPLVDMPPLLDPHHVLPVLKVRPPVLELMDVDLALWEHTLM